MIQLLDENTINQIAAGEVIENTSSIIKELVENSIDAQAKNISIEIVAGGRQQIKIIDDGIGIPFNELPLAIKRHATSKIRSAEDLAFITSMGFRGEALSSIASISKLKIFSKQKDTALGGFISCEGGQVVETLESPMENGTRIEIAHLFYNTPVRRKFLKSIDHDTQSCLKAVQELCLSHLDVGFQLISNQKFLIKSPQGCLKDKIVDILGTDYLEEMVPVLYKDSFLSIEGFVSLPSKTRPNRSGQYLIVNQRLVSCPAISFAVQEAYATMIEPRRFALFVLQIHLKGDLVDVNVHPQKKEIRLRKESLIRSIITSSIEKALHTTPFLDGLKKEDHFNEIANDSTIASSIKQENNAIPYLKEPFHHPFEEPEIPKSYFLQNRAPYFYQESSIKKEEVQTLLFEEKSQKPELKFIGFYQSCLLVEKNEELYLLHPQRALQKIYYDEYQGEKDLSSSIQQLLRPITLHFSLSEANKIKRHQLDLLKIGIEIIPYQDGSFIIQGLADGLSESIVSHYLTSLLDEENMDKKLKLATSKAQNEKVDNPYLVEKLFSHLAKLNYPPYAPNGKPIFFKLSIDAFLL